MHGFQIGFKVVQRRVLCRSRREVSNAYFLAKFGFDTAENEPSKVRGRRPRHRPSGRREVASAADLEAILQENEKLKRELKATRKALKVSKPPSVVAKVAKEELTY